MVNRFSGGKAEGRKIESRRKEAGKQKEERRKAEGRKRRAASRCNGWLPLSSPSGALMAAVSLLAKVESTKKCHTLKSLYYRRLDNSAGHFCKIGFYVQFMNS